MTLEEDGRIDISCSECGGHMGHIFDPDDSKGNRYAQRHCVNDSSIQYMKFDPAEGVEEEGRMTLPS